MLWSVINETDIFYNENSITRNSSIRSSNPYDYLCNGYFLDNGSFFGGDNFVNFNSDISSNRTGNSVYISVVR